MVVTSKLVTSKQEGSYLFVVLLNEMMYRVMIGEQEGCNILTTETSQILNEYYL